jgi:16S rRNA (guanine527-N7)-methyltransferase
MNWFGDLVRRELPQLALSEEQVAALYAHYTLLERWNERMNLTSVEPGAEMVIRHYCESLFFAAQLPVEGGSVADIGSGAGFPGIPLAILKPKVKVVLVESNQRKGVFLLESSRLLKNVDVVARRAEEVTGPFDWIVARGVTPTGVLALVPRLAPKIGLMLGEGGLPTLKASEFVAWSEPIRLPWGDRRICVYGST